MIKRTVRKFHTKTTNKLGYYLAGLIEGDESLVKPYEKIKNYLRTLIFLVISLAFLEIT